MLNDAITINTIAVIVQIFGDSGGNEEFLNVTYSCSLCSVDITAGSFIVLFLFFNHSNPLTALTVMIWVRIAHKTSALTAHLSFIRGWPKPARKYRGMRFPWPPGMLSHCMHKSQSALQR